MRYRLLQELPRYKVGEILDADENDQIKLFHCFPKHHPDFFEPILDDPKRWRPKEGETFYCIKEDLIVDFREQGVQFNKYFVVDTENCFHTAKQAEEAMDAIKKLLKELHEKWGE